MSGLGAIFNRRNISLQRESLQRMSNALALYGPAKNTSRAIENFGLCVATSGNFCPEDDYDHQPVYRDGRHALAFSGFLHHRDELSKKLALEPSRSMRMADSALVYAAWQKWGRLAPIHLYGTFAFILVDQSENSIFAVRSSEGAVPIFYHKTRDRFVFGSVPKAIFALGDIDRELDETRIADSLILNYENCLDSYYRNIHAVPMGHILEASSDRLKISSYIKDYPPAKIRFKRDEEYVDAANELLEQAIASTMRSASVPAIKLSSGLDSPTVAVGAMDYLANQPGGLENSLVSYTAIPEPGWDGRARGQHYVGDESGPVRALAEAYPQLDAHFIDSAGLPLDHELDKLILLSEIPAFGFNNLHWVLNIHQQSKQSGHNVLLDGTGGNSSISFDGSPLYAKLFRQGHWAKLFNQLSGADKNARAMGIYSRAIKPNLPHFVQRQADSLRGFANADWQDYSAIHPDYAKDMGVDRRAKEMNWDTSYLEFRDPKEKMAYMQNFRVKEDGQSLVAALQTLTGVQSRDPLSDRKLTDFCLAIPDDQFMRAGKKRYLIRRMMAQRLPAEIFNAPPARQGADWHLRMTRDLPMYRKEIERMGDDVDTARRFDVPRLKKLLDTWPDKTPVSAEDHPDFYLAAAGMGRAIATSRFINWVNGKN